MQSHTTTKTTSLVVLMALSTGCGVSVSKAETRSAPRAIDVTTVAVAERTTPLERVLTGTLHANREATIAAAGSGRVLLARFERGDRVRAHQVLVRLDGRAAAANAAAASASVEGARAELTRAQNECARADRLLRVGAIGSAEHERLSASCSSGASSVRAATAQARLGWIGLSDATVRAPFDGLIAERSISLGDFATPGRPVATLVDTESLRLEIAVPESAMTEVRSGQTVSLEVTARPGERFWGSIRWLGPSVRSTSRDVVAEAIVPNHDGRLAPGMFALARVALGERRAPAVPLSAVRRAEGSAKLWVLRSGRIEERIVALGPELGHDVIVETGVQVGEEVVTNPTPGIRDGIAAR